MRPLTAHGHRHLAAKVAVSHFAAEIAIGPDIALAAEAAIQRIGRRVGQGDAQQRVQVGQVSAGQLHLQVEALQLERIEQQPAGMGAGTSGSGLEVDPVAACVLLLLQVEQRGDPALHFELVAAPLAAAFHCDRRGVSGTCGFTAVQGNFDTGVLSRIKEQQLAAFDPQTLDACRRTVARRAEQVPVATLRAHLQAQARIGQFDGRNQGLAPQQ